MVETELTKKQSGSSSRRGRAYRERNKSDDVIEVDFNFSLPGGDSTQLDSKMN